MLARRHGDWIGANEVSEPKAVFGRFCMICCSLHSSASQ